VRRALLLRGIHLLRGEWGETQGTARGGGPVKAQTNQARVRSTGVCSALKRRKMQGSIAFTDRGGGRIVEML